MSLVGLRINDPRTGIRVQVIEADEEAGRHFQVEYVVPQGGPREVVMHHWHRSWTEHFEILSGHARYRIGRSEADLAEGASARLPAGTPHLHPWNVGKTELRVRQTSYLAEPDPAAVRETLQAFAMLAWLSRQGKVNARGLPHPLQAALILQTLQRHGGFLPGAPVPLQRVVINTLASWARRSGYTAFDPACLGA